MLWLDVGALALPGRRYPVELPTVRFSPSDDFPGFLQDVLHRRRPSQNTGEWLAISLKFCDEVLTQTLKAS
jgi:hypothetical protein